MRTLFRIIFILLIISFSSEASSLFRFDHIQLPELNNNNITSIVEDKVGFMWFGSRSGLFRYDGYTTSQIDLINEQGEEDNFPSIEKLLVVDNMIWIGTLHGVYIYNTISERSVQFDKLSKDVQCRTLYKTKENEIVIGTDNGLYIYTPQNDNIEAFICNSGISSGISHNIVRSIYEDKNKNLWIGTFDQLNKFDRKKNTFTYYYLQHDKQYLKQNNLILSVVPQKNTGDTLLQIGTETGWCVFNTITEKAKYYFKTSQLHSLSNNAIKCSETVNQFTWLGTDLGLNIFDPQNQEFKTYYHDYNNNSSISSNVINDIYYDSKGYVWLATDNGVDRTFANNTHVIFNQISNNSTSVKAGIKINDIVEDDEGNFYFATDQGLYKYNIKQDQYENFQPPRILHNKVIDLLLKDQKLWISTSGGLNIYDIKKDKFYSYIADYEKPNWIKSNYLNKIVKDGTGSVWVNCFRDGLYKVECCAHQLPEKFIKFNKQNEITGSQSYSVFNSILIDSNYRVWAKNGQSINLLDLTSGVFQPIIINEETEYNYKRKKTYYNQFTAGENGIIWIATSDAIYKHNSLNKKTEKELSFTSLIKSFYADSQFLIFATTNELYQYTFSNKQLIQIPSKYLDHNRFVSDFYKSKSGRLYIGCEEGFMSFYPQDITVNSIIPHVLFSEFRILDEVIKPYHTYNNKQKLSQNINNVKSIELTHSENTFSINLSTNESEKCRFKYYLKGYDKEWQQLNKNDNTVQYTRLAAGKYIFKAKAINQFGIENGEERRLNIRIKPPLYASKGAYAFYFVTLIILLLLIRRILLARIEYRDNIKAEIIQREKSEELVQVKSRFFTNVSHELRTPLSLILGPVDRLIACEEDEEKKQKLKIIKRNSERLIRLVNQILDLRKIEKNQEPLRLQKYDIVRFCNTIFMRFIEEASYRNVVMHFSSDISVFQVWIDIEKMEKIMDNLLSNALKFTQDGGHINLQIISSNSEYIEIKLSDTGIGIPKEEQEHIFERFFNISDGNFSRQKGTGIGLSLVSEYVQMHNGRIELESKKNEGSTFRLFFPLDKEKIEKYELLEIVEEHEDEEKIEETKPNQTEHNTYLRTILLIDDEPDLLAFLEDSFSQYYKVYTATDGEKGWKSTLHHYPDLIISDVIMPNMTGIELCRKIKQDVRISHIPIILLTAKGDLDSKISGIKTGADDYISKPFSIEYLLLRVKNIIEQRKNLQDAFIRLQKLEPTEVDIKNIDDGFLEKLMNTVEENISNSELSAKLLTELTGLSHNNLYRKLKTLTGQSINEFIRSVRLKRAAQLLKKSKLNITEVMYEVGFTHNSYFTRCFKEVFGITPKQYHKQATKNDKE